MSEEIVVVDVDDVCRSGVGIQYRIEFEIWGDGTPQIVMLHDGLGSVAQWREVPIAIADRCGVAVLAYDRPGHGNSQPIPKGSWPIDWLSNQAELLGLLLGAWKIDKPMLVGHSDGASIALLYASGVGAAGTEPLSRCRGVVSLAAHSFVEPICAEAISILKSNPAKMDAALAPYHANPRALFEAWSGVWQSSAFTTWDIRPQLGAIDVPTWVVQGEKDEYGTEEQAWTTSAAIGQNGEARMLPGLGHLLHHEDPDVVVDLVVAAWGRLANQPVTCGHGLPMTLRQPRNKVDDRDKAYKADVGFAQDGKGAPDA